MYLHSQLADALPWGCCSASLPSHVLLLRDPPCAALTAETQGAELTSKLKLTLTMAHLQTNCHFRAIFVFFIPLSLSVMVISRLITQHVMVSLQAC